SDARRDGRLSPLRAPSAFFFFSSRRRHTRSKRDWSSDVCSSDLLADLQLGEAVLEKRRLVGIVVDHEAVPVADPPGVAAQQPQEIGRASCRERGEIWVGAAGAKTKTGRSVQGRTRWPDTAESALA